MTGLIKCAICDKELGELRDGAIVEEMEQFAITNKCGVLGFGPGIFHDEYHTNMFICQGKCCNSQAARWLVYLTYKLRNGNPMPYADVRDGQIKYGDIELGKDNIPRGRRSDHD